MSENYMLQVFIGIHFEARLGGPNSKENLLFVVHTREAAAGK